MRNCKWLGFRVPLAIVRQANDANQYYPFAISLIESVRTYEMANEKVCIYFSALVFDSIFPDDFYCCVNDVVHQIGFGLLLMLM